MFAMRSLVVLIVSFFSLPAQIECWSAEPDSEGAIKISALDSGVQSTFRGLAVRDKNEAWVAGSGGVVLKTTDGGASWNRVKIPDAGKLDFRDVEVFADGSVLLMSVGEGESSNIFRSTDGGETWRVVLKNQEPKGFFDGFAFDDRNGVLYGDPLNGRMDIYRSIDRGATWTQVASEQRPKLVDGEYGFAASGTGIVVEGRKIWIATGGATARVHHSTDFGAHWTAAKTGIRNGNPSSGIFSIDLRDGQFGVAIGGDYLKPDAAENNVALTNDGGKSWKTVVASMPHKACVRILDERRILTCGRTGVMLSSDRGRNWKTISEVDYYVFGYEPKARFGFLAGKEGRLARFEVAAP